MATEHDPLSRLIMVQEHRARKERDLSIAALIEQTATSAAQTCRKLGEITDLWTELVPPEVERHTSITNLRRGVLHVTVDSAATSYELDRQLRSGLLQELRRRYTGTLLRVRIKVGEGQTPNATQ